MLKINIVCVGNLKDKFYIVPGKMIQIGKALTQIVPTPIVAKVCYKLQKSKAGK